MPIIDSLSEYKPITDASNLEDLQTTPLILDEEENEVEVIWDKQPIVKKNISLVPESKTKGSGMFGFVTPIINKGLSVGASLSDIISEFDWKSSELNPTKEGLTSKDLYKKENFSVIQNMMKRRYGMDLKYNKAEDIVSSWRQMMKNRDMYHAGNSVTMFNWLTKATDADKKATKDSIELWTEVGGAFQEKERQLFKEENLLENKYVLNEKGQLDWDYYKNKPVSALYPDGSPSRLGYEGEARSLGKQSVIDTAQAVLTDPINIIPIITFGRIKTKQARKLATVFRQKEINHIKNNVLKDKRYKDLKSKKVKIDYEVQKLTWKAMQSADIQFSAMKRALLGSSGINAASNAAIDWLNQTADITVDIKDKDEYSKGQTATIATLAAVFGGGANFGYHALFNTAARNALRGKSPAPYIFEEMIKNRNLIKKGVTGRAEDVWKNLRPETISAIGASLRNNGQKHSTWLEKVERGQPLAYTVKGEPVRSSAAVLDAYLMGNADEGIESIEGILRNYGIFYNGKRTYLKDKDNKTVKDSLANWLIDVTVSAPKEIKKEIRRHYRNTLGSKQGPVQYRNPKTNRPYSFEKGMDIMAAELSKSADVMGSFGRLAQSQGKLSKKNAKELLEGAATLEKTSPLDAIKVFDLAKRLKSFGEKIPDPIKGLWDSSTWLTKTFIRGIITNPGTTWLNYNGWKIMTGLESTGRMAQMALHGGNATLQALVGRGDKAGRYSAQQWRMAENIFDNQIYKVQKLLDIETTVEEAASFMAFYPEAQKLMKWASGGIEVDDMNKYLGLPSTEPTVAAWYKKPAEWTETAIEKAQIIWGTKSMDIVSKSAEFMTHIDYLTRRNYNMGIDDFLNQPEAWRVTESDIWAGMIADSVSNAQKNTFAKSFKEMKGMWGTTLGLIEDLRNVPLFGTKTPFGQFFNNTVAFQVEASGLSALHRAFRANHVWYQRKEKEGEGRTIGDLAGFAAASYTALFYMAASRREALEEGIPWFAERDDAGRLRNYRYDYPRNLPMWLGTVGAYIARGDMPPADLMLDGAKTFTYQAFTRGATLSLDVLKDTLLTLSTNEYSRSFYDEFAIHSGKFFANIGGGGLRAIEPFKDISGMLQSSIVVDKRIGPENINQLARYTDTIQDWLISEDSESVALKKFSTRGKTEKFDALNFRPLRFQPEKMLGFREEPVLTTAQRMLNMISKPYWKGVNKETKSIFPEVNNVMTRIIAPKLEYEAEKHINSRAFVEGTPALFKLGYDITKQRQIIWEKQVVAVAFAEARDQLKYSLDPTDERLQLLYEVASKKGEKKLAKILSTMEGNKDRELTDLSVAELKTFIAYMDDYDDLIMRELLKNQGELSTPTGLVGTKDLTEKVN